MKKQKIKYLRANARFANERAVTSKIN